MISVAAVGTPVPEELLQIEEIGMYAVTSITFLLVYLGNSRAIRGFKRDGGSPTVWHWFPTAFSALVVAVSVTGSLTAVFETNLDGFVPPIAPAIVVPPVVFGLYVWRSQTLRELLPHLPLRWLFLPHVTRLSGAFIILLVTHDALAPHVGWPIGLGDIACALLAPLAYFAVKNRREGWQRLAVFGIADFVFAVFLTVATLPGPVRLFTTDLDSTVLSFYPVGLAPTSYVPMLYLSLFLIFLKVRREGESG